MSSIRDLPIYLTTSNGREHIIKVFCHLFNKYWGSDSIVNLVGYEQPNMDLPDNFNFISMGEQVGGIQMWSTDLRKFFLEQECDNFIHVLDDQFISAPVRFDIMQDLYDVMLERDAVRVNLNNIREDITESEMVRSLRLSRVMSTTFWSSIKMLVIESAPLGQSGTRGTTSSTYHQTEIRGSMN